MLNSKKFGFWINRPLLTDTLPYETPVIFSNDKFYYALSRKQTELVTSLLGKITASITGYTVPYSYSIRKDDTRTTTLGIIHPLLQVQFCGFYFRSEGALLSFCSRSEFSIRHPTAVAAVYVDRPVANINAIPKLGQIEVIVEHGEPELDRMVSYFAYGKYNLLSKFYESTDFVRLEKKFSMLRHLDISKCFYSIYTHTIAWATKDKEFAKENRASFSFEAEFDRLMQNANYSETNGIVVGPEISRIFAEIILQDIDRKVVANLRKSNLFVNQNYVVRRYVDDYSIFANSASDLSKIEGCLRVELESYKLYLNDSKRQDFGRPFISGLSIARAELAELMARTRSVFDCEQWRQGQPPSSRDRRVLQSLIHELRVIVKKNGVQVGHISGWAIGNLRAMVRLVHSILDAAVVGSSRYDEWYQAIIVIIGCAFYLASLDVRVRTTYSLCQILITIYDKRKNVPAEYFEQLDFSVATELALLAKCAESSRPDPGAAENVELYNILICGSHLLGEKFSRNASTVELMKELNVGETSYFKYITAKFCYLRNIGKFASELNELNDRVEKRIGSAAEVNENTEIYLLMCDFLGSPDIPAIRKKKLYERIYGGSVSAKAMDELTPVIGFVDWDAMKIEHTLKRKQLRPVYAVA